MRKILLTLMIVIGSFVKAQEVDNPSKNTIEVQDSIQTDYKIKRISIGIGLGVPIGGFPQVQYTLPFLNNHLAPYFIYTSGNYVSSVEDVDGILKFSEFGVSYFFNEKGKGLYLGLGISNFKIDAVYNNISLDIGKTGFGTTEIILNTANLKLGLKTGGRIYLRLEVGYGMGNIPQTVSFNAKSEIKVNNVQYTETTTQDIPKISGISENGLIIGNIGLGLSF